MLLMTTLGEALPSSSSSAALVSAAPVSVEVLLEEVELAVSEVVEVELLVGLAEGVEVGSTTSMPASSQTDT